MIECYEFSYAKFENLNSVFDSQFTFRYTNGSDRVDFIHPSNNSLNKYFYPAAISREELSRNGAGDDCIINTEINLEPINILSKQQIATSIFVKIYNTSGVIIFTGKIKGVEFDLNKGIAKIECANLGGALSSKIPTRTFSSSCSFECFDENCRANRNNRVITARLEYHKNIVVGEYSFSSDAVASFEDGWFDGGIFKYGNQFNHIITHKNGTLELAFRINIQTGHGQDILIAPSCDKSIECCEHKFNNLANFGGFAWVPKKNCVTQGF